MPTPAEVHNQINMDNIIMEYLSYGQILEAIVFVLGIAAAIDDTNTGASKFLDKRLVINSLSVIAKCAVAEPLSESKSVDYFNSQPSFMENINSYNKMVAAGTLARILNVGQPGTDDYDPSYSSTTTLHHAKDIAISIDLAVAEHRYNGKFFKIDARYALDFGLDNIAVASTDEITGTIDNNEYMRISDIAQQGYDNASQH